TGYAAAAQPGARAGLRVEEGRAVVLFGVRGRGGIAAATDRFPGPLVELVFAAVGPVGGDRFGVAARLAGGDRFERRDRHPARQVFELFLFFPSFARFPTLLRVDLVDALSFD